MLRLGVQQRVNRLAEQRLDLFPRHLLQSVREPFWPAFEPDIAQQRKLLTYFQLPKGETLAKQ